MPTPPSHGTVTQDVNDQNVTYTNNGDSATSDFFVWQDFFQANHTVTVTITSPLSITTSSLTGAAVGVSYSQAISATGGTTPYTFTMSSGSLPAGLSLSAGGVISGTPTAAGTFSFAVQVKDNVNNTATKTYSGFTVSAPTISLLPSTLPAATQNSSYSQSVTASGGTAPYNYLVTSGSLPSGLSLNIHSGALSGTPTVFGSFPITISATDSTTGIGAPFSGSRSYTLTVAPSMPTITTGSLANGEVGASYSQTISASSGTTPYTFSMASGSLPLGLSLSSGGVLSGTPTASGSSTFTVRVTDANSNTATQSYTVTIATAPSISTASLGNGEVGLAYSQTISASGGATPYTFTVSSGTLPTGLNLSSGGVLSGTPTSGGSSTFTVQVRDANNVTATQSYTVSITAAPSIGTASLASGEVGASYSQTISASGGTTPYTFTVSSGTLPTGLNLSSGGVLSGTPTAGGSSTFTVQVKDANNITATQSYTVTIAMAPSINTASLGNGEVGLAYSQTISASGGTTPYTFTVSSGTLPTGLSLSSGGVLSGTPTAGGSSTFTVQVKDVNNVTATQSYTVSITAAPSIGTASLGNGEVSMAYSQTISASGGTTPYAFSVVSGSLPTGLSLSSGGVLSGTPTAGGSSTFTVQVKDANNITATQSYTVTIATAPSISTASLGNGEVGLAYSQTISASGGTTPYTFTVSSGTLPTGLNLSSGGVLSGTPTAGGSAAFTVQVKDANNVTATQSYTVAISAAPSISTASLASGEVGASYSQTISASGGATPYAFSVISGSLPTGLSLSSGGVLSGTPTAGGSSTFTVQVKDANNITATQSYTVSITAAPGIGTTSLGNGEVGLAYSQTISASGGTTPYTFTVSSGTLPTGLSLSSGGVLSGTPTAGGSAAFTVQVKDANNVTATQSYTVSITAAPSVGTASLASGEVGVVYSQTISASGGTTPYTFTVSSGTLPTGLSLSSGGVLSGTPTAGGSAAFTVQVKDANNVTATQSYTVSITAAPSVGTASLASGEVGVVYSQTISASGGTTPYTFTVSSGTLPTGLSLSSGGVLSGTPTAGGSSTFTVQVKDANNITATQSYTVSITAAPSIGTTSLGNGEVGLAYSQTISASGGTAPYTFSVTSGTLPTGLSLSSGGVLSGTPTAGGSSTFTVQVKDANNITATQSYTITIAAAPSIGTTSLGNGEVGVAYSQTISASGGTAPYTFSITSGTLPTGLSLSSGGVLSGTPTAGGSSTFTVQVKDANNILVTRSYTVTVAAGLGITTTSLGNGEVGVAYSQTISIGGGTAPYTFTVSSGSLPAGLSLSSGGALSGTPTAGGSATFTVQVKDANNITATQSYTVAVAAGLGITTTSLGNSEVGVAYSQTIGIGGGTAPYTFNVSSGALPAGLSLSGGGALSGTPTMAGSFSFAVQVKDANNATATQSYVLTVTAGVGINTTSLAAGTVGSPYNQTISASGGTTPYAFTISAGSLPAGLTLAGSGVLAGTPTASGSFTFTAQARDARGATAAQSYTMTVNMAPVPVVPTQRQITVAAMSTATVDITDGATGAPYTGAAILSVAPASAGAATILASSAPASAQSVLKTASAGSGTYSIQFVPAAAFAGTAVITYTLSNASGASNPATLSVIVAARPDPSTDPDVVGLINAQIQAARRFADAQMANYGQRLENLHGTGRTRFSNGLSVAMPNRPADDGSLRCQGALAKTPECLARDKRQGSPSLSGNNRKDGADQDAPDPSAAGDADLAFWTAGLIDFGFNRAGTQRSGFRFTTGGVTLGADYRLSDRVTIGAGVGYGHDSTDIGGDGTRSTGDSYNFALYGSYRPQPALFIDGVAGYGTLNFDSRRWVGAAGDFALGSRNGTQAFASVTAGYEHRDKAWLVSPYGRFAVSNASLRSFTESGAGSYALTYFGQTVNTVSGTLGLRTEYTQPTQWGVLMPYARIEYQHDFTRQSQAGLAYADLAASGPAYYVTGTPFGSNRGQLGIGAKLNTGTMLFGLDYSVLVGVNMFQQGLRLWFSTSF
ncbi:putative Ig domain-containing protein [Ralstonia sp. 24A2]|uniref:putative Ig domain-containing protein n=1 Tax=Ralstonia sp. 24A2 TaxID=3447364 RepID=UPI003F695A38